MYELWVKSSTGWEVYSAWLTHSEADSIGQSLLQEGKIEEYLVESYTLVA